MVKLETKGTDANFKLKNYKYFKYLILHVIHPK